MTIKRQRVAWVLAVACLAGWSSQAWARRMAYINFSDVRAPVGGILGYNAAFSQFQAMGGVDDLVVGHEDGQVQSVPGAHFVVNSGFTVISVITFDSNGNGLPDNGDLLSGSIGSGDFDILTPAGIIVHGVFTNAKFSSAIGSGAIGISTSTINGLQMTTGPVGYPIDFGLLPPDSLAINAVGIEPGIQIGPAQLVAPGIWVTTMQSWGLDGGTSGSVDIAAETLIPEPATACITVIGMIAGIGQRCRSAG